MKIRLVAENTVRMLGKNEKVLVNPAKKTAESKALFSRLVLYSRKGVNELGFDFEGVIIEGPGEYEVGGVGVRGWRMGERFVYLVNIDELAVCVTEDLDEAGWQSLKDKASGTDVLLLIANDGQPVAAGPILKTAKDWGINYLVLAGFSKENAKAILDELDREDLERVDEIKIEATDLPDGMEVVMLAGK